MPDISSCLSSNTSMMQAQLMKAYMALPDMEDILIAINNWLTHELVDTRSYVTAEELDDLWSRACELKLSVAELAFLFSFLVASGASSLTSVVGIKKETLDALYSVQAATKFATAALELLYMDSLMPKNHESYSNTNQEYDWMSIARCPPLLLASRTHSILCCFFHQARQFKRGMQHGNIGIQTARGYGVFGELHKADVEEALGIAISPSRARHLYGLRRLQFDLSVYPRLAMSLDIQEQCILQFEETCKDTSHITRSVNGQQLKLLALDYQRVKLVLAEVRAITYQQSLEEIMYASIAGQDKIDGLQMDTPSRILANDDATLAIMAKLPSWTQVDSRSSWTTSPIRNVFNGTTAINILWARLGCNRQRTKNLLQIENQLDFTQKIQARALMAAQDTLFLLAQVLYLLKAQYKFGFSHDWLYKEADWAIDVFNKVMFAEIALEMAKVETCDTSSRRTSLSAESTTASTSTSTSVYSQTSRVERTSETTTPDVSSPYDDNSDTKSRHFTCKRMSIEPPDLMLAKHQSYKLFAWYIFGFERIYATMQDLHCVCPALFESSKMLMRLRVPRPIQITYLQAHASNTTFCQQQQQHHRPRKVIQQQQQQQHRHT